MIVAKNITKKYGENFVVKKFFIYMKLSRYRNIVMTRLKIGPTPSASFREMPNTEMNNVVEWSSGKSKIRRFEKPNGVGVQQVVTPSTVEYNRRVRMPNGTIVRQECVSDVLYRTLQTYNPDKRVYYELHTYSCPATGKFSSTLRKSNVIDDHFGKVVRYLDSNEKESRVFAKKGLKAILERFALKIATDSNGYEREGLRKIGGMLFELAKKIKV